ncbi:ABC transporter permease [Variovorax sp. Sphag1AA]|uniref:ABC transporter permease n=1 Tax=Variovorax sp. Sphag1AA TaxID=2587027 RepID=UPI0016083443|nr:ABC transporter permease [Variovorax sp. Sphag1AA]MBB3181444.1 sulfonate transport system permease protein [Variovorax sp. Sphag1AA]
MTAAAIGTPAKASRAHSTSSSGLQRLGKFAGPARRTLVVAFIVAIWQAASWAGWVNVQTLASPAEVWQAAVKLWRSGELLPGILVSLRRVSIGLAIGVSIGTVLGVVAGLSRVGEEIVDAPLQMLRALPFLGLLPLLIVWLGIGEGIKVGLVVIGVIFPVYLNLHKGIRAVDPRFAELTKVCGVNRWGLLRWVILPGAWPSFLVGLRYALGIAWLSLVVTEAVNADAGVGYLIQQGQQFLQTDVIVLGLVIYALLGLLLEAAVRLIEWQTLGWRKDFVSA